MLTLSTRYVIRKVEAPRLYYAGFQRWVPEIERAYPFNGLETAEDYAMIELGLTMLSYTLECLAVTTTVQ